MAIAKINLKAVSHNVRLIKSHLSPNVQLFAAVKANAYGHGAIGIAKHLSTLGINWFGVATPTEAIQLHQADLVAKVLVLNPVYSNIEKLIAQNVRLSIVDKPSLIVVEQAAKKLGQKAIVHLKVDTGMGRLGSNSKEALEISKQANSSKVVVLEGIWTHFACADDKNPNYTYKQLETFQEFLDNLKNNNIAIPVIHAANSAAVFAFPESHFDMVRVGIALYGYHASTYTHSLEPNLKPVMTVTAPITFVKRLRAGQSVSYGATWTAEHDTTIATVRYGYADGYPRILSNRASVWYKGKLRPVRGRVCMDQLMIDMCDDVAEKGESVTFFGDQAPNAADLAKLCNTIPYEILTSVGNRVERILFNQ